jgi:hypothetical protein
MKIKINLLLSALSFLCSINAHAFVYIFTGSGHWNNAANWSGGNMPPSTLAAGDEVEITGSATLNVNFNNKGIIYIRENAQITIVSGITLDNDSDPLSIETAIIYNE